MPITLKLLALYKDFPAIIRNKGLNGYGKEQISTPEPDSTTANVTVKIGNETYKGTLIKS